MRTHPDPLTCSTGCFLPSLNVPKALIRSDIWFSDGNIVIVAGSAAFRVHRGQLERHSEVFKDMFLVGCAGVEPSRQGTSVCTEDTVNEEGNKIVDGCPTVDIYDCPSDVYHLLVALYDGLYVSFPTSISPPYSILTRFYTATSPNPTPATSRCSPASSVYPRNTSSSTCASNVSHGSPTTGPPRLQTGTDERQHQRMPVVATHPATHTPTPSSPSTSPSSSAYPKYSPVPSTTCRDTDRAGFSPAHAYHHPYSQPRIPAPRVRPRTVPLGHPWTRHRHRHRRRGTARSISRTTASYGRFADASSRSSTSRRSSRARSSTVLRLPVSTPRAVVWVCRREGRQRRRRGLHTAPSRFISSISTCCGASAGSRMGGTLTRCLRSYRRRRWSNAGTFRTACGCAG